MPGTVGDLQTCQPFEVERLVEDFLPYQLLQLKINSIKPKLKSLRYEKSASWKITCHTYGPYLLMVLVQTSLGETDVGFPGG